MAGSMLTIDRSKKQTILWSLTWGLLLILLYSYATYLTIGSLDLPFCGNHLWNSCATAMAIRSYDDWGFFHLAGKILWLPKTPEIIAENILQGNVFHNGYPPLYVFIPYFAYKLVNLFFHVDMNFAFIQVYSLIFNRFLSMVVGFVFFKNVYSRCFPKKFTSLQTSLLAFISIALWLLTPGALYNTQNIYYADQAVFLPALVIYLIIFRTDLFADKMRHQFAILFFTALWASGCEWYGTILVVFAIGMVCIRNIIIQRKEITRQSIKAFAPLLLGVACNIALYSFQISHGANRQEDPVNKFLAWFGINDFNQLKITLLQIVQWWQEYVPVQFQNMNLTLFGILIFICLLACALGSLLSLKNENKLEKANVFSVMALFVLTPLFYILLLIKHSYVHDYSVFKLSLTLTLSLVGPIILSSMCIKKQFWKNFVIISIGAFLIGCQSIGLPARYNEFSTAGCPVHAMQGEFIGKNFKDDFIVVSNNLNNLSAPMGSNDPVSAWYSRRSVISPEALYHFVKWGLIDPQDKTITFTDFRGDPAFELFGICNAHTVSDIGEYPVTIDSSQDILKCKTTMNTIFLWRNIVNHKISLLNNYDKVDLLSNDSDAYSYKEGLGGIETEQDSKIWRWGLGPQTNVGLLIQKDSIIRVDFDIFSSAPKQTVTIMWNDAFQGRIDADPLATGINPIRFTMELPARQGINELKLLYTTWNGLDVAFAPSDNRPLGVCFSKFTIESKSSESAAMMR
ncbi:MAG: hypothetical protein HQK81_14665 [Desulfovibrionaceae bacterium]|nr:hypothetical protein [Desulfovibrionaceae bacterium]MBF0515287.1 hypothetical protein [Desulfovibrionaceae bacterium]